MSGTKTDPKVAIIIHQYLSVFLLWHENKCIGTHKTHQEQTLSHKLKFAKFIFHQLQNMFRLESSILMQAKRAKNQNNLFTEKLG